MKTKKVVQSLTVFILSASLMSGAGFAETPSLEKNTPSQVYKFLLHTDTYHEPSLKVEKQLDLLLTDLDDLEHQSRVIYNYIKYRDQLEISNFYNPLEETLFKIGQDGYALNTLEDLDKLDNLYEDFNALSRSLLPLEYKIHINDSKITITEDYDRLISKYKPYMLYEPLAYLEIMKAYEGNFSSDMDKLSLDSENDIKPCVVLLAQAAEYLKKPNKDFAFEHVKQAYRDMAHQLYSRASTDLDNTIGKALEEIMPQSQMAMTYQDYLDKLKQSNMAFSGEIKHYVDELIGKQISQLTLASE